MLYFIVLFFVLYANHLFIKRRSKEIGLYQLVGMTKGLVTRLIAFENILLFGRSGKRRNYIRLFKFTFICDDLTEAIKF